MNATVIVLTGTSGAGKTTTCTTFARRAEDLVMMFGMDLLSSTFVAGKFTMFGERRLEHLHFREARTGDPDSPLVMDFGPLGWRALTATHEMIAAASRSGQPVIVDHIALLEPPILQDLIWRLADIPVLFVALKPPRSALAARLATRTFELPPAIREVLGDNAVEAIARDMQRSTPWLYDAACAAECFDLEIDTTAADPDEVCAMIEARLTEGPGTAFPRLRERYPDAALRRA